MENTMIILNGTPEKEIFKGVPFFLFNTNSEIEKTIISENTILEK